MDTVCDYTTDQIDPSRPLIFYCILVALAGIYSSFQYSTIIFHINILYNTALILTTLEIYRWKKQNKTNLKDTIILNRYCYSGSLKDIIKTIEEVNTA